MTKLLNKDNVIDIFKDVKGPKMNEDEFEQTDFDRFLKYKLLIKSSNMILQRIKLVLGLKLMGKMIFLKVLLKRIEIIKELFIADIELGKEVKIPNDLSQEALPRAFRYYDFILNFVQARIGHNRKEYYGMKRGMAFKFHKKHN